VLVRSAKAGKARPAPAAAPKAAKGAKA
jgi:hypothetical protein